MTCEDAGGVIECPTVSIRTQALEVTRIVVRELSRSALIAVVHRTRTTIGFGSELSARALTRDRTTARLNGQLGRTLAVDVGVTYNWIAVVVTVQSLLVGSGDRDYTHGEVEAIHLTDVHRSLGLPHPLSPKLGQSGGHCSPLLAPYSASYNEKVA